MSIDKVRLTSSDDVAKAVIPEVMVGDIVVGDKALNKSIRTIVDEIFDTLREYGYHPRLYTNKRNVEHIRKNEEGKKDFGLGHVTFDHRRTNFIYCDKCFRDESHSSIFNMVVIGVIRCGHEVVGEGGGERIKAIVKLSSLFPHCNQCDKPKNERRNYLMDFENPVGNGWHIDSFPLDTIFQDIHSTIIQKLNNTCVVDGEIHGNKIENITKGGNPGYNYDNRYNIVLREMDIDSMKFYNITGTVDKWIKMIEQCMKRLLLWYANTYNVPNEAFDFPNTIIAGKKLASLFVGYSSNDYISISESHLYLVGGSLLVGGHKGEADDDGGVVHQLCHRDIKSKKIDNQDYTVSKNPHLCGKNKPCSILIPFGDEFGIVIKGISDPVKIKKGEHIAIAGDLSHMGETYVCEDVYDWRPRFHVYIGSDHHDVSLDEFEVDIHEVALTQTVLLPRLNVASQLKALDSISEASVKAFAASMESSNTLLIRKKLLQHINELTAIADGATAKRSKR